MSPIKVQFYEVFEEESEELRRFLPSSWNCGFTNLTIQEARHLLPPSPVISIRTQSVIPPEWSPHLSAILSRSAGYDHLQRFLTSTADVPATGHLFRYSGRSVAEHAMMLWMSLLRGLPRMQASVRSFQRDHLTGKECQGRCLAVFGVGDIGYHTAQIGRSLGMNVLGVDLVPCHDDVTYVTKEDAIRRADIIVAAMNLNETNQHYFDESLMSHCKPGALFINISRGEFISHALLVTLLEAGIIGGAGLDVYDKESLISHVLRSHETCDHPEYIAFRKLLDRPDVIMTPHNAFNTREALTRKSEQSVKQLEHFFTHGSFITYSSSKDH